MGNTFAFQQLLPTGVSPEGLLPIGARNLFVTANEVEGTLSIFRYEAGPAKYPTIHSIDSATEGAIPGKASPIPWGALSALAADRTTPGRLFTVHDSAYANARIYSVDATSAPARIVDVTDITGASSESWDLEGIATRPTQAGTGFWLASEGNANANAAPTVRLNHLLRVAPDGTVQSEIPLPAIAGATPTSNGFEGVTAVWNAAQSREEVFVAVQRSWDGTRWTRIARYIPSTGSWDFAAYPLDAGSNVGLSEIVAVGPDQYAVIERDNLGGPAAVVKRIYRFSLAGYSFVPISSSADPALVTKVLVNDLLDELRAPKGRVIEKVEGLTVDAAGQTFLNTDNDAEDGESQFFRPRAVARGMRECVQISPPSGAAAPGRGHWRSGQVPLSRLDLRPGGRVRRGALPRQGAPAERSEELSMPRHLRDRDGLPNRSSNSWTLAMTWRLVRGGPFDAQAKSSSVITARSAGDHRVGSGWDESVSETRQVTPIGGACSGGSPTTRPCRRSREASRRLSGPGRSQPRLRRRRRPPPPAARRAVASRWNRPPTWSPALDQPPATKAIR